MAKPLHIVVLGAEGVGKTALISKYLFKALPAERQATIEDHYHTIVRVGGNTVTLDVIDTAGVEEYSMLYEPYVAVADGLAIVFSLLEKPSLDRAMQMIDDNAQGRNSPFILVGNKADLLATEGFVSEDSKRRHVGCYFETSALTGANVVEAWECLITRILKQRGIAPTPTDSPPPSPAKHPLPSPKSNPKRAPPPRVDDADDDSSDRRPRKECLPVREACVVS